MSDLFPDRSAEQVHAAVSDHWDLSGVVPVPAGDWLRCPICGTPEPQPRWWKWHVRSNRPTVRHRCDVAFKCVGCSMVWVHGVPVDAKYFTENATRVQKRVGRPIHWREVRAMLEETWS